jgi:hypothetical protein
MPAVLAEVVFPGDLTLTVPGDGPTAACPACDEGVPAAAVVHAQAVVSGPSGYVVFRCACGLGWLQPKAGRRDHPHPADACPQEIPVRPVREVGPAGAANHKTLERLGSHGLRAGRGSGAAHSCRRRRSESDPVITQYAAPSADGTGYVIHRCFHCGRRHFVDGTGRRWLRCGIAVEIRSTEDKPVRR